MRRRRRRGRRRTCGKLVRRKFFADLAERGIEGVTSFGKGLLNSSIGTEWMMGEPRPSTEQIEDPTPLNLWWSAEQGWDGAAAAMRRFGKKKRVAGGRGGAAAAASSSPAASSGRKPPPPALPTAADQPALYPSDTLKESIGELKVEILEMEGFINTRTSSQKPMRTLSSCLRAAAHRRVLSSMRTIPRGERFLRTGHSASRYAIRIRVYV